MKIVSFVCSEPFGFDFKKMDPIPESSYNDFEFREQ